MIPHSRFLLACLCSCTLSVHSATAAIISGVEAKASSEFGGRPAINAVNGSGLTGNDHSNSFGDMWLSANGDTTGTFEVDLGAIYNLDTIQVWNYNEGGGTFTTRGVQAGTLDIATTFGNYSSAGPTLFAQAPGTAGNFSEIFPFGGTAVRYLRLNIGSNHGDGGFTGLSELRFDGTLVAGQEMPIPVLTATATSEFGGREAIHSANGNGLFGLSHTIQPTGTMYLSNQVADPDITYDLGSIFSLDRLQLWNYNEVLPTDPGRDAELLGRGGDEVNILVSDDNINFTQVLNHNFAIAGGDPDVDFSETVSLGGASGRYVKLDVVSNHGNVQGFTGISEVQFFRIPEPSIAALLGVFGLAALLRRRRRA